MHEGSQRAAHSGALQVRIVQDNGGRLATQFENHRLHVFTGGRSDDRSHVRAPGKADFPDGRMSDQGGGDFGSIGRSVVENVEAPRRKTSLAEDVTNRPKTFRRQLGAFEDRRVTRGEGKGDGAGAEDVWSVPAERMVVNGSLGGKMPQSRGGKPTKERSPESHRMAP